MEAFVYASKKTAAFYDSQKRLATEHAVFNDSGAGDPVREAGNGQGMFLSSFTVLRLGADQQAFKDPAKLALLEKKDDLEQKIDTLKYQKAAMDPADYKKQLTDALLEFAKVQDELDQEAANEILFLQSRVPADCAALARAAEPADCWSLRKHGATAKAQDCFDALTRSASAYDRAEGFWGLEEWEQANAQFRLATQPADSKAMHKVRWGMLLHERFNDGDALGLFQEALQKDPSNAEAYVGLATISSDSFDGQAGEYLAKATALDPKLAEAHELMADLALTNDDPDAAAIEADKAIALENDALDAMAIHAALELFADRSPDAWFAKIKAINPNYGEPSSAASWNTARDCRTT